MRSILFALGAAVALAARGVVAGAKHYGNTTTSTVYVTGDECLPVVTSTLYYTLPVSLVNSDVGNPSSLTTESIAKITKTTFLTVEVSSLPVTTTIKSTATLTTSVTAATESTSYTTIFGTTTSFLTTTTTSTTTVFPSTETIVETFESGTTTISKTLPTTTSVTTETTINTVVANTFGLSVSSSTTSESSAIISSEIPQLAGPGPASSVYTTSEVTVLSASLTTFTTTEYITSTPSPSIQTAECTTYVSTEYLTTAYVYTHSLPSPSDTAPGEFTSGSVVIITSDVTVVPELTSVPTSTSSPILETHTITISSLQTLTKTLVPETTIALPPVTLTSIYNVTETLAPASTVTSVQTIATNLPSSSVVASSSSAGALNSTGQSVLSTTTLISEVLMTTFTVYSTTSYTISKCAPSVVRCPYGSVTTETISEYVTTCPVAELTSSASATAHVSGNATQTPSRRQPITSSGFTSSVGTFLPSGGSLGWNASSYSPIRTGSLTLSSSSISGALSASIPSTFSTLVSGVAIPTSFSRVSNSTTSNGGLGGQGSSGFPSQTSKSIISSGFVSPLANSSVFVSLVSSFSVLPIGSAASTGFPPFSVNSSIFTSSAFSFSVLPIGSAASSGFPAPSVNISVTTKSTMSFSRSGSSLLPFPSQTSGFTASSSFPTPTANSSVTSQNAVSFSSSSVSVLPPFPSQTSGFPASSGFANPSANSSVTTQLASAQDLASSTSLVSSMVNGTSSLPTTSAAVSSQSHHIIPILGSSMDSPISTSAVDPNLVVPSSSIVTMAASLSTSVMTSNLRKFWTGTPSLNYTAFVPSYHGSFPTSTVTSTSPGPSSTCGEHGDFTLNFDDIPPLSAPANTTLNGEPIFSPYHQFYFSQGFSVVPLPVDPYLPSSGSHLLELEATDSSSNGGIGNGYKEDLGCFNFNAYGASLGCDSQGTPCIFTITGMRYNSTIQAEEVAATQFLYVPICPGLKNCSLVPVNFDDTFFNLNSIQINATDGYLPKTWFIDDLRLGWANNTCDAGLCRQNHI